MEKVCIIGAGSSGIASCQVLAARGIPFDCFETGSQIGGNWDPTHHHYIDMLTTFTDKDYMLGLTSAQTTLGAIGRLVGATVRK